MMMAATHDVEDVIEYALVEEAVDGMLWVLAPKHRLSGEQSGPENPRWALCGSRRTLEGKLIGLSVVILASGARVW